AHSEPSAMTTPCWPAPATAAPPARIAGRQEENDGRGQSDRCAPQPPRGRAPDIGGARTVESRDRQGDAPELSYRQARRAAAESEARRQESDRAGSVGGQQPSLRSAERQLVLVPERPGRAYPGLVGDDMIDEQACSQHLTDRGDRK